MQDYFWKKPFKHSFLKTGCFLQEILLICTEVLCQDTEQIYLQDLAEARDFLPYLLKSPCLNHTPRNLLNRDDHVHRVTLSAPFWVVREIFPWVLVNVFSPPPTLRACLVH